MQQKKIIKKTNTVNKTYFKFTISDYIRGLHCGKLLKIMR